MSTHCGHTICVECAIKHWVRGAIAPPNEFISLSLGDSSCPLCRQANPAVITTRVDGVMQRDFHCLPFVHDFHLAHSMKEVWKRLRTSVRKLHAQAPTDHQAIRWMETYGRDNAGEQPRVVDRTR